MNTVDSLWSDGASNPPPSLQSPSAPGRPEVAEPQCLNLSAAESQLGSPSAEVSPGEMQRGSREPQIVLIARARRGDADAIAALLQRDLQHHGIEVSAWTRGRTLRVELMSPFCLTKPEAMAFIHSGMDYLQADGIGAVQVSAYVQGEYDPRWVERLHLKKPRTFRALPPVGRSQGVGMVKVERLSQALKSVRAPWAVGIAVSTVLVGAVAIAAFSGSETSAPKTNPSPTTEQVTQP